MLTISGRRPGEAGADRAGRGSPRRARRRSCAPRPARARHSRSASSPPVSLRVQRVTRERPRIDRISVGRAARRAQAEADRAPGRDLEAADRAGRQADRPAARGRCAGRAGAAGSIPASLVTKAMMRPSSAMSKFSTSQLMSVTTGVKRPVAGSIVPSRWKSEPSSEVTQSVPSRRELRRRHRRCRGWGRRSASSARSRGRAGRG